MARDGEVGEDQVGGFPGCYLWGGGHGSGIDGALSGWCQDGADEHLMSSEEPAWRLFYDQP